MYQVLIRNLNILTKRSPVHMHYEKSLLRQGLQCILNADVYNVKAISSSSKNQQYSSYSDRNYYSHKTALLIGACIASSVVSVWFLKNKSVSAELKSEDSAGLEKPGLPTYTSNEVAAHDTADKKIWVCYKSGVYDITNFVAKHPGGEKILMAAGASLEPFWELFAVHKTQQVLGILEEYRIGNLSAEDRGLDIQNMEDPFASDPRRHPILKPRSVKPFNAEPPMELLAENFLTPNEVFFVRNHLPVPEVDPKDYELEVGGRGIETIFLKLDDLKSKFKRHTITSTIQCAGNRRSELNNAS